MNKLRRKIYQLIPGKLKFKFSSMYENLKNGRPYYSHNGEDVVLLSLFKNTKKGFYVDIGAHHPKKYSNTYLLHKLNWSGINIDANPESIELFKKFRPSDININIGVSDEASTLTFHEFADPAVNTFSESQAKDWIENKKWNKYLGSRKVDVETINDILKKHLPKGQKIDLLSIDVESLDQKIIKSLDMTYKPTVIVVEDQAFNDKRPLDSPIYKYLTGAGYMLHGNLGVSLIFKVT